jgi:cytidylate kinase
MAASLPASVERNLETHIRVATRLREAATVSGYGPAPFVTISRQYGCEAIALAEALTQELDKLEGLETGSWQIYGRQIIEAMADQEYSTQQLLDALDTRSRGAIEEFLETIVGQISDLRLLNKLIRAMRAAAHLGRCVLVGRGGALLTRDMPGGIHVRLVAPEEVRLKGLVERFNWSETRAREVLRAEDESRRDFFRKYLHQDANDPVLYDLTLNTSALSRKEIVELIRELFESRRRAYQQAAK